MNSSREAHCTPPWLVICLLCLSLHSVSGYELSSNEQIVTNSYPVLKKTAPNSLVLNGKRLSDPNLKDDGGDSRLIIVDGGTTDNQGIAEFFIYFGAISLAIVCFIAFIGIILGLLDQIQSTPASTGSYGVGATDSYSSYKRIYDVASALDNGYSMYENQPMDHQMLNSGY